MKVEELAKRWKVSPSTIYNLVEAGRLPCYRIGRGRGAIRFTEEQADTFLASCLVADRPDDERLEHIR